MAAQTQRRKWIVIGILVPIVAGSGLGAIALVRSFLASGPPQTKQVVQDIKLIRPPPPPPDVPPPPPPPPEEKVDIPDPQQQPDPTPSNEPPPGEQLGLDAEGGAGGDAFGLLGHKGGRELTATGGSAFAWYAGLLRNQIQQQLGSDPRARSGAYTVDVRVWIRPDGTIERIHLARSSGDRDRDQSIEAALTRLDRLSQAPPTDMPEPITLRIVSRG